MVWFRVLVCFALLIVCYPILKSSFHLDDVSAIAMALFKLIRFAWVVLSLKGKSAVTFLF